MLKSRKLFNLLCAGMLVIFSNQALAAFFNEDMQLSPYLASEQYSWKESTPVKADFLNESGTRYVFGLEYSNFNTKGSGRLIGVDAKLYTGAVGYSGHAFSLTSNNPELKEFNSSTQYTGNIIEFNIGHRSPFKNIAGNGAVDFVFSFGSDFWQRDIGGGALDDGTIVSGYAEYYHSLYAKMGMGLLLKTGSYKHLVNIGIKRPLTVNETIDFSNLGAEINLSPRPATTAYASWRVYPLVPSAESFTMSMYFEETKFYASDAQTFSFSSGGTTHTSSIYQPDSSSTVAGLQLMWKL